MRKKTSFKKMPKGPWPVRALWEGASEPEQKRAHTRCVAILEYWLGKVTKNEVAQRLDLPPLRIWQLSQQALSGMLAALVHQPRWREAEGVMTSRPEKKADVAALKKRIAELEKENATLRQVNELLRQFPPAATKAPAKTDGARKGKDAKPTSGEKTRTKKTS
jgi:hypothetical protein